jgi:hypothetical protein
VVVLEDFSPATVNNTPDVVAGCYWNFEIFVFESFFDTGNACDPKDKDVARIAASCFNTLN